MQLRDLNNKQVNNQGKKHHHPEGFKPFLQFADKLSGLKRKLQLMEDMKREYNSIKAQEERYNKKHQEQK